MNSQQTSTPEFEDSPDFRVHRKQFVIGPKKVAPNSDWRHLQLTPRLWLSHDRELRVRTSKEPGEPSKFLLGEAIDVSPEAADPDRILDSVERTSYRNQSNQWNGRWCLIFGKILVTDCCGLLGVFTARLRPDQGSEEYWFSSSPALLLELLSEPGSKSKRYYPKGVLPPATRNPGINRLLANCELDLETGLTQFGQMPAFERLELSHEEIVEEVVQILRRTMQRYQQHYPDRALHVALSGGADSRRNGAACHAAAVPFEFFSFKKPWIETTSADDRLPRKIARTLNAPLHEIRANGYQAARADALLQHAGSYGYKMAGGDYYYFCRGFWEKLGRFPLFVDGQAYELGANYYYHVLGPDFTARDLDRLHIDATPHDLQALEGYWARELDGLQADRRDMLFWTYNICGNYSVLYQRADLFADSLIPANNRRLYSLFFAVSPEKRQNKQMQMEVTKRLAPTLAPLPTNYPCPLYRKLITRTWNRISRKIR
jgi:hypothetical protein